MRKSLCICVIWSVGVTNAIKSGRQLISDWRHRADYPSCDLLKGKSRVIRDCFHWKSMTYHQHVHFKWMDDPCLNPASSRKPEAPNNTHPLITTYWISGITEVMVYNCLSGSYAFSKDQPFQKSPQLELALEEWRPPMQPMVCLCVLVPGTPHLTTSSIQQ